MEENTADWINLFEKYPFFESYKHYLQIDIMAQNEDDFRQWHGWVESRLRILTLKVILFICFPNLLFVSMYLLSSTIFC
jgi:poly(A) polymerase